MKPISILIFVIVLFVLIVSLSVASYLSSVKNIPPIAVQPTVTPIVTLTPEPTIVSLCSEGDPGERISCFTDHLVKNPISEDIINSDDKLKAYFIQNFDNINSDQKKAKESSDFNLTFMGISRGKFDKNSDKEVVVVSFEYNVGKFANSYLVIIKRTGADSYQALSQTIEFQSVDNQPRKLVKDEPPFLISNTAAYGGTCVNISRSEIIYRLVNGEFESIWNNEFLNDGKEYKGKLDTGKIQIFDTKIIYKDLDNDGDSEIIKEGTRQTCEGENACWSSECTKFFGKEKIYEVYKWDTYKQTFIKAN
ncbi:hypothetical protein KKB43_06825 [Patescibacteria group bacterium]|nr:hypothetical protein [Patescibacteria group bacterium]MBU4580692.1 hypothetical protein [Patescibacteria group bacterium]